MYILAVSSDGGHWEQLRAIFNNKNFSDITIDYYKIPSDFDVSRESNIYKIIISIIHLYRILKSKKFEIYLTTGALPGLIGLVLTKIIFKKKSIWIDSIANYKKMSTSGRIALMFSNLTITQSKIVAKKNNKIEYLGSIF